MDSALQRLGIDRLSVVERLDLIGQIWDSIEAHEVADSIPGWHQDELMRRLDAADADPDGGIPWDVVKQRIADRR